ncbi:LysR family transcriptional regulator [Achromobacter denitrificans]|nr:LysR family transcriptional regulator [Achromobacter denitrificans]MDF3941069.1 LysR family transcriptional regulator [Achromobacter denitrificans]
MLDLDLLHSFVSVVDAGGFTAAGERVHRSQSTVSQQIRKLEESLDCALFVREGRQVSLTEDGERLLGYARRMLALSTEVREAVSGRKRVDVIRLGIPDDFAADTLTAVVSAFARSHPDVRLSVRCDLTAALTRGLERGDLDVALVKREPGAGRALAAWPENLHWIASPALDLAASGPVPLVAFPQGCIYRNRAIHAWKPRASIGASRTKARTCWACRRHWREDWGSRCWKSAASDRATGSSTRRCRRCRRPNWRYA